MTDNDDLTSVERDEQADFAAAMAVTSNYKILGQLNDYQGVGVLGQNDAGSGTAIGVKGVTSSSDGYGLETPDDAKVGGVLEVTSLDTTGSDFTVRAGTTSTDQARNVVLGHAQNEVKAGAVGATIGGGGRDINNKENVVTDDFGTIGGGVDNRAGDTDTDSSDARFATVSGGRNNTATDNHATVGGGQGNDAKSRYGTIAGGVNNEVTGNYSAIPGGSGNSVTSQYAAVGGGVKNDVKGNHSTIGGGRANTIVASARYATIAGGGPSDPTSPSSYNNVVYDMYGTIGGGGDNQAGSNDNTKTSAEYATVAGGKSNLAEETHSTVAGGTSNAATAVDATISGGQQNTASADSASVGGGFANDATAREATLSGGASNTATALQATVGGGKLNDSEATRATIAGGLGHTARGTESAIGGGDGNSAYGNYDAIGGGNGNRTGFANTAANIYATVGGGENNIVSDKYGAVGGGGGNLAGDDDTDATNATYATVAGGQNNAARDDHATVAGGKGNAAIGNQSVVGGGQNNRTGSSGSSLGSYAVVPGGRDNVAKGGYSLCAGRGAESDYLGSFVWSDHSSGTFAATADDQFLVDASGGVGIGTNSTPHLGLTVLGANVSDGFWGDHLVGFESTTNGGDVLALRNSAESGPGGDTNFITFFGSATDTSVGAIQGTGGGVELKSGNFDIAEYFPKADPGTEFEAGDVVGLREGAAVADPTVGGAALVVSASPMVSGNVPDEGREDEFVCLALTGQVPVRVRETVRAGEVLVAGEEGRAVPAGESARADAPTVGLTLRASDGGEVRTLVGGHGLDAGRLEDHADGRTPRDDRIETLERENESLREANADLRERLAAVEAHLGVDGEAGATPADD